MRKVLIMSALTFFPAIFIALSMPLLSWAHGFAGKRFFPTTLSIEDPFVSDELSFLFNSIKESGGGGGSLPQIPQSFRLSTQSGLRRT